MRLFLFLEISEDSVLVQKTCFSENAILPLLLMSANGTLDTTDLDLLEGFFSGGPLSSYCRRVIESSTLYRCHKDDIEDVIDDCVRHGMSYDIALRGILREYIFEHCNIKGSTKIFEMMH